MFFAPLISETVVSETAVSEEKHVIYIVIPPPCQVVPKAYLVA